MFASCAVSMPLIFYIPEYRFIGQQSQYKQQSQFCVQAIYFLQSFNVNFGRQLESDMKLRICYLNVILTVTFSFISNSCFLLCRKIIWMSTVLILGEDLLFQLICQDNRCVHQFPVFHQMHLKVFLLCHELNFLCLFVKVLRT